MARQEMAAAQDSVSSDTRDIHSRPMSSEQLTTIYGHSQSRSQTVADNNNINNDNANGESNINGRSANAAEVAATSQTQTFTRIQAQTTTTNANANTNTNTSTNTRPLILITDSSSGSSHQHQQQRQQQRQQFARQNEHDHDGSRASDEEDDNSEQQRSRQRQNRWHNEEQVEEVDGISYRIVAAVTKPASSRSRDQQASAGAGSSSAKSSRRSNALSGNQEAVIMEQESEDQDSSENRGGHSSDQASGGELVRAEWRSRSSRQRQHRKAGGGLSHSGSGKEAEGGGVQEKLNLVRRKSSAFVSNLLHSTFLGPQSASSQDLADNNNVVGGGATTSGGRQRRLSIYEMTKSPPPETSLEIYLSERRRSSTKSSKQIQQQLEQQSTFETNYCQRQQYFKDLNQKLINHDKKLLNVVANRGQIHRHSVDIAQLPLHLAQAKGSKTPATTGNRLQTSSKLLTDDQDKSNQLPGAINQLKSTQDSTSKPTTEEEGGETEDEEEQGQEEERNESIAFAGTGAGGDGTEQAGGSSRLVSILEDRSLMEQRGSITSRGERIGSKKSRIIIRKFQKLDQSLLSSTPAPDVKIGQRVAYKEYYGNEFGTIRWIGRVPQICPDWTAGVEFDNAIGEGDGSLNGRRYFIAKDCFAKFLPLNAVAFVDQHVGRPEPGTMISVMSAAVRPGQMISIQRVSTVHVQHCFLNAPHQRPMGADILAVNTRLHCQCPNCGPCAHVIKPPRTQRLARGGKNATHMCQFSTYTCCGMEGQEETMCTYTGNKVISLPPPISSSSAGLMPIGNSWTQGAGYLTNLQAQQSKLMPEEYRRGAAPEDIERRHHSSSKSSSRRGSGRPESRRHNRRHHHHHRHHNQQHDGDTTTQQQQRSLSADGAEGAREKTTTYPPSEGAGNDYSTDIIRSTDQNAHCQNNNMQYSPSPISQTNSPYQNLNQFAVACPDKVASYEDTNWYDTNGTTNIPTPKSAKVVYRDSIDNRYLFPTDDPIDSKLEADLENLSQARYGPNGSRNIFKSLRSLVSCLSAQSSRSELEWHSENTMRFSEKRGEKDTNKSMPAVVNDAAKPNDYYYKSEREKDDLYTHNSYAPHTTDQKHANNTDSKTIRRHISSSSDCGFSSASQNSINFQSYAACSPTALSADEERRTNQIYKRIVTRLMSSKSVTNEDLLRLKKVLLEPHFENCCIHNSVNQTSLNGTFTTNAEPPEHIVADLIQKSFLCQDKSYDQMQGASSARYHQYAKTINYSGGIELTKLEERQRKIIVGDDINPSSIHQDNSQNGATRSSPRSLIDGSSTSESATLSSFDSFSGTAVIGGNNQSCASTVDGRKRDGNKSKILLEDNNKLVNNANLPKAFELKLTLSINSDKTNQTSTTTENQCELVDCSSVQEDISNSSNTFNISIVSGRKEELSENTKKVVPKDTEPMTNINTNVVDENHITSNSELSYSSNKESPTTILNDLRVE